MPRCPGIQTMVGEDFVRMAYSSRTCIRSVSWRGLLPDRWFSSLSTAPRESERITTWGILAVVAHSIALPMASISAARTDDPSVIRQLLLRPWGARRKHMKYYLGYFWTHPCEQPC